MKAVLLVCIFAVVYASALGGIGGSTDSNKCLTGAGYTWCSFENKCVRPWELAKEKGLEMSAENVAAYCSVLRIGASKDSNGCITSAGYSWCAKENKCVKPWELASAKQISLSTVTEFNNYCNNGTQKEVGNDQDSHSCLASAGYSWCEKQSKCVRPWELTKSLGLESTPITFQTYCANCLASAGYSYCYAEQKCVRPWELAKQLSIEGTPAAIQTYCAQDPATKTVPRIGGEEGSHACLAGAGYTWCQKEGKCVRPWELISAQQIENTPEAFDQYCNEMFTTGPLIPSAGALQNVGSSSDSSAATVGGESDNHGCLAGAGYTWCQKESKCVRPWELAAEKNIQGMTAETFASYCQ